MKLSRKRSSDATFDHFDDMPPGKARVMLDRFLERVRVAELGQQLRRQAVQFILAFEQHAVEIEDDRVKAGHQSSNNAVPTRTAVAPSITAAL